MWSGVTREISLIIISRVTQKPTQTPQYELKFQVEVDRENAVSYLCMNTRFHSSHLCSELDVFALEAMREAKRCEGT